MYAMKLVSVLCTFSLLGVLMFVQIAEAKTKPYRRHVSDRHHQPRYENRLRRVLPHAEAIQRYRQDGSRSERDTSCLSLLYLPEQYSCSPKGGY